MSGACGAIDEQNRRDAPRPAWMSIKGTIWPSRNPFRSSSGFSRLTRLARPIRNAPAGLTAPSAHTVAPWRSLFASRPGILQCRTCRRQTGLLVGTVMERSHTPLNIWFWAAYLVASQTPGISAVQFQRQLALSRYKTAFGILHTLRAGMVRPDQESAASLISMSKLMKPTSAARPVAKAGASITRFLSPVFCRSPPREAKYCPG